MRENERLCVGVCVCEREREIEIEIEIEREKVPITRCCKINDT